MITEQCKCCGMIDTLFQINQQAVCGSCFEDIRQRREDIIAISERKAMAARANRTANASCSEYEGVTRELRRIKDDLIEVSGGD